MQNSSEKRTQWCGNGPKVAHLGPKPPFLARSGLIDPPWLVKVEQMVDHSKTCLWYLPLMQNSPEKCTQWCGNGPKVAHLGPKSPFLGHKRPQTPQMACKSGSNGGSQLNTCRRTNLGAKLVRKMHPVVWKWPQICPFGAKNDFFLPQMEHFGAISTPLGAFFWRILHLG